MRHARRNALRSPTPLRPHFDISALRAGHGLGMIGLCGCPGRAYSDLLANALVRDLDADIRAIRDFGATALVTLMEHGELEWAAAPMAVLGERVAAHGMRSLYLPIADGCAPDAHWEAAWDQHAEGLLDSLRDQRTLVLHCRGGRGRAGLVAARLLMAFGENADAAIARVRAARPGAIETSAQENYLRGLPGVFS